MAMTEHQRNLTYTIAVVVGAATAVCTLMIEHMSGLPEAIALPLVTALFPGFLGGAALSGNVHGFSLWSAAAVNFVVYFGLTWGVSFIVAQLRRTHPETDAHS